MVNLITSHPTSRSDYFRFETPEYNDASDVLSINMAQAINTYGLCFRYYVRTYDTKYDMIWGEDNNSRYVRTFDFMGMYSSPDENVFFTKFGIDQNDDIKIHVVKRHFEAVSNQYPPKTGDVIERLSDNVLFEVLSVPPVNDFTYFQRPKHIWEIIIKTYKDESIIANPVLSATTLATQTHQADSDIFDVRNIIDTKKDEVLYQPKPGEKPQQNPYANW